MSLFWWSGSRGRILGSRWLTRGVVSLTKVHTHSIRSRLPSCGTTFAIFLWRWIAWPSRSLPCFHVISLGFLTLMLRAGTSSPSILLLLLFYYCFPPPSFVHSVLLHFLKFECRGLLLVPVWPASSFWTLIAPDGVHLARWAVPI